jgi:hypothetical protein
MRPANRHRHVGGLARQCESANALSRRGHGRQGERDVGRRHRCTGRIQYPQLRSAQRSIDAERGEGGPDRAEKFSSPCFVSLNRGCRCHSECRRCEAELASCESFDVGQIYGTSEYYYCCSALTRSGVRGRKLHQSRRTARSRGGYRDQTSRRQATVGRGDPAGSPSAEARTAPKGCIGRRAPRPGRLYHDRRFHACHEFVGFPRASHQHRTHGSISRSGRRR